MRLGTANAANWKNDYIREGWEKGLKKGIGKCLRVMLEGRFGTLPESVNSFIASSDSDSLLALLRFAVTATSLQAITEHIKEISVLAD